MFRDKILAIILVCFMLFAYTMPASALIDTTTLQTKLDEFIALDPAVYTPATYRLAEMEFVKGRAVIENLNSTQSEVDNATTALANAIASLRIRNGSESLWQTYKNYFEVGNIFSSSMNLDPSTTRGRLTRQHFNSLTAENHMKPDQLSTGAAGSAGTFRIHPTSNHVSDILCRQAQELGITVHGHVLVWHGQTPNWINGGTGGNYTRAQARSNMERYIRTVVQHFDTRYPGVVTSWDVVNEAFVDGVESISDDADWRDYLRQADQSGWMKSYSNEMADGEHPSDFIYDAFVFTRRYTEAKLFYNDFNMYQDGKSKLVAMMVKELNARYRNEFPNDPRQLIEGVGMQSHNYILDTPPSSVERGIRNLLTAGVDLIMSELDLFCWFPWNAQPTGNTTAGYMDLRDRRAEHIIGSVGTDEQRFYWANRGVTNGSQIEVIQAEIYAEYFRIYKNYHAHIDRVTFWGLRDRDSWRRGHNPLLWNSDWSPKDAFYAVSDPEGYLNVEPFQVKPHAAPNVAEIILDYNNILPSYRINRHSGNYISDVARLMGPRTDFSGVPESILVGDIALSNPAYRRAVYNFLKEQPGIRDRVLIMPPDTFFISSLE